MKSEKIEIKDAVQDNKKVMSQMKCLRYADHK